MPRPGIKTQRIRRPRLYAVQANVVTRTTRDWTSSRALPTFYLDPDVQGIRSVEHARDIAVEIVDPFGTGGHSVTVEPIY